MIKSLSNLSGFVFLQVVYLVIMCFMMSSLPAKSISHCIFPDNSSLLSCLGGEGGFFVSRVLNVLLPPRLRSLLPWPPRVLSKRSLFFAEFSIYVD